MGGVRLGRINRPPRLPAVVGGFCNKWMGRAFCSGEALELKG